MWIALSSLFLDTELGPEHLSAIAQELLQTKYTVAEIEEILFTEVYPACIANLHSMLGIWEGFSLEVIENRIRNNEGKFWKTWAFFQWSRWMIRKDWLSIREILVSRTRP